MRFGLLRFSASHDDPKNNPDQSHTNEDYAVLGKKASNQTEKTHKKKDIA